MRGRRGGPPPGALAAAGAALVVTSVTAAGCAGTGLLGGDDTHHCASWVAFATPADAAEDADLVVLADGARRSGTARALGAEAHVHTVTVLEVLDGGGAGPGDELAVVSTPVTCSGDELYPGGDPLDTSARVVVLLHDDADVGGWRTLTPAQGVVTASPGGGLPDGWEG